MLYTQKFSDILGAGTIWSASDKATVVRGCKNAQTVGFSYYGLRNESEFVAESVAQYYCAEEPGEIAQAVVRLLTGGDK